MGRSRDHEAASRRLDRLLAHQATAKIELSSSQLPERTFGLPKDSQPEQPPAEHTTREPVGLSEPLHAGDGHRHAEPLGIHEILTLIRHMNDRVIRVDSDLGTLRRLSWEDHLLQRRFVKTLLWVGCLLGMFTVARILFSFLTHSTSA